MPGLTLYGKIRENYFFSDLYNKLKDNILVKQHNIQHNMGIYSLIYSELVLDDISNFLNNKKNTLEDSTKDIILKIIKEIILPKPLPFNDEDLPFDRESVVFYSFVLETLRRLVGCDFDEYFVRDFDEANLEPGDEEEILFMRVAGHNEVVSDVIYQVLNRTVYDYIVQMKSVKQNAIQKTEFETIAIKKNLPEDVEKNIISFANNRVMGGRKSKKSNRKTKKRR
jgi:hypothetical protein